jgi:hypothetical protein
MNTNCQSEEGLDMRRINHTSFFVIVVACVSNVLGTVQQPDTVISMKSYDSIGAMTNKSISHLYSSGLPDTTWSFDSNLKLTHTFINTHRSDGLLLTAKEIDSQGALLNCYVYDYVGSNLVRSTFYVGDTLYQCDTFIYSDGLLTKMLQIYPNNASYFKIFHYNIAGKVLSDSTFGDFSHTVTSYQYDADTILTLETVQTGSEVNMRMYYFYEAGVLVEKREGSETDSFITHYTWSPDHLLQRTDIYRIVSLQKILFHYTICEYATSTKTLANGGLSKPAQSSFFARRTDLLGRMNGHLKPWSATVQFSATGSSLTTIPIRRSSR